MLAAVFLCVDFFASLCIHLGRVVSRPNKFVGEPLPHAELGSQTPVDVGHQVFGDDGECNVQLNAR